MQRKRLSRHQYCYSDGYQLEKNDMDDCCTSIDSYNFSEDSTRLFSEDNMIEQQARYEHGNGIDPVYPIQKPNQHSSPINEQYAIQFVSIQKQQAYYNPYQANQQHRHNNYNEQSNSNQEQQEKNNKNETSIFNIFSEFDTSFLIVLLICNFTQGFKQFLDLSLLNLFKDEMKLETSEVAGLMGMIAIPQSFKIVYGFISDNINIFGSKRKGHIILMTMLCALSMALIMQFGISQGKYFVAACVLVSQITMAWNDTVTDALTVQLSQNSKDDISENLNSISIIMQGVGAITGAIMASLIQNQKLIGPYQCFGIYLILQSIFFTAAIFMNQNLEPQAQDQSNLNKEFDNQDLNESQYLILDQENPNSQKLQYHMNESLLKKFSYNIKTMWSVLKEPTIYFSILYFLIRGAIVPSLDNAQYYFMLEKCNIDQSTYDLLSMGQSVGIVIGTLLFLKYLSKCQVWKLILVSGIIDLLNTLLLISNQLRLNLKWGVTDIQLNAVIMLLSKSSFTCLAVLPMTIQITYVVPQNIAASLFATLSACFTFSQDWSGDMLGSAVCEYFKINSKDMSNLLLVAQLKLIPISIMIILVCIIPNNQEMKRLNVQLNQKNQNNNYNENELSNQFKTL